MENLGLLLKSLMGPRQTFQPGGGNLMEAMQMAQQPQPDQMQAPMQAPGMAPEAGGWRGGLADLLDSRVAMPMAAGLLSGKTPAESFGNAFALGGPALGKMHDQKRAGDYLSTNFPDLAQMVSAGMPIDAAWGAALKKKNMGSDVSYGKSPSWGLDDQGNPVMGVVGDDGTFKKIDTPGFHISKTPIKMDLGDSWALLDPVTRQPIQVIPKNLEKAATETALGTGAGKGQAEATAAYRSMSSKMPGLETVVTELRGLADKATYTALGQGVDWTMAQAGMEPREAAIARTSYEAKVSNQILPLLRDTFGSQFTEREGETLRQTMGDVNKTPKQKQAVLDAFIEQKRRDIEAAAKQAGPAAAVPPPGGGGGAAGTTTSTGVPWSVSP